MMLKKDKKVSRYKKALYCFFIIIFILLAILLMKINANEVAYDSNIYNSVYGEYYDFLEQISNIDMVSDIQITDYMNERIKNISEHSLSNQNSSKVYKEIIGTISISKINLRYPIISETTYENLKIAPTKFFGCNPNEVGNLCVVGHNNRNKEQFSQINKLDADDVIQISGTNGSSGFYQIYEKCIVDPNDLSCTSQDTKGEKHLTLITCTNDSKKRLIVKCKEI